jgi:hypothetical protein
MAKEDPTLTVGVDDSGSTLRQIENDCASLDWSVTRGAHDVTGVNKSAIERLQLLADFSITLNILFNDAGAPSSFDTFKTVGTTSVARTTTLVLSGQTLTNEVFYSEVAWNRAQSGELTGTATGQLATGVVPTWS